jgi:hypothetical protein
MALVYLVTIRLLFLFEKMLEWLCHISGFYLLLLSSRRESGYASPMP